MQWVVRAVVSWLLVAGAPGCTLDRLGKVAPDAEVEPEPEPDADAGPGDPGEDAGEVAPVQCTLPTDCVIAVEHDCCGGCEVAVTREDILAELCIEERGDEPPRECLAYHCEDCPTRGPCRAGLVATCAEGECIAIAPEVPGETDPDDGGGGAGDPQGEDGSKKDWRDGDG